MIGSVPAHVACLGLVALDMAARATRIRLLVSRLGGRLSVSNALRLNLLGDAAAELTPFRIAGEPSRLGGLVQSGVAAPAALLAVGAELVLSYAMLGMLVIAASWTTLPAWWSSIGPALARVATGVPWWTGALLGLAVAASIPLVSRLRHTGGGAPAGLRSSLRTLGAIGRWPVAAVFVLGAVNVAARVGILWVLVSSLPGAPAAGTVLVGSFLLLFGQAFAPTPSGLGVVEMGMLGGAAGPMGGHAMSILVYWRVYTAILPIALAAIFALPRFGVGPLVAMFGVRRRAAAAVSEGVEPPVGQPILTQ